MSWARRGLAVIGILGGLLGGLPGEASSAWAGDGQTVTVVSWAPTSGPRALWNEGLNGLAASAAMFNANGGLGGHRLAVETLDWDGDAPESRAELASRLARPDVAGAVGGVAQARAGELADYLRRIDKAWLGPWSNQRLMYRAEDTDPFAVLPSSGQELKALLGYVRKVHQAEPGRAGPVFLVYYNLPADQDMAAQARLTAAELGLELKRAPINPDFNEWPFLAEYIETGGAVIIWLSQGHTAALIKAAKARKPDALYLTNSVNATNRNLVIISGGAWNGLVFPAVLAPSQEIPTAYEGLLRKYGPPGLDGGYQSYLGFAQGQILARALSLGGGPGVRDLSRSLFNMNGFPTLLAAPVQYAPGRQSAARFYLGRAYGNGQWEAISGETGTPEPE